MNASVFEEPRLFHAVTSPSDTAVFIEGEFTADNAGSVEALFDSGSCSNEWRFAVDLTECTYIDSVAISKLIMLWRRYSDRFEVRIRPSGLVHKVFDICGFLNERLFVRIIHVEGGH